MDLHFHVDMSLLNGQTYDIKMVFLKGVTWLQYLILFYIHLPFWATILNSRLETIESTIL